MKKMFFTAIALIAFTGVSMANTKEEKKEDPKNAKKEEKKEVVYVQDYCDRVWVRSVNFNMSTGDNMWTAMATADKAEAACRNNPDTQNLP